MTSTSKRAGRSCPATESGGTTTSTCERTGNVTREAAEGRQPTDGIQVTS